jgi:hypothetical protein
MSAATFLKTIALWLLLAVLATVNGILRETALIPASGTPAGLMLSGFTLSVAILLVSWLALPWYGLLSPSQYWRIGLVWLLMTILFEFGLGYLIARKSWAELLDAYDIATGNLWLVVLATTLVAPRLSARLRKYA